MRAIIEHSSAAKAGVKIDEVTSKSLAELGWTSPDLGIDEDVLVRLAAEVMKAVQRAHRDLPVSPESQFIQDVINKRFETSDGSHSKVGTEDDDTLIQFSPFSFERYCLEQSILMLTQIDATERSEAFSREMTVIVGPEFGVYGIMFRAPSDEEGRASFQTRLRCNDLNRLQAATSSFVSAIYPAKTEGAVQSFASQGASIGRRLSNYRPFVSNVHRLEIRSVTNERLFDGRAIPVTGRFSLLMQVLSRRAAQVLLAISILLIVVSAALFAFAPDAGWWQWCEQLVGRLATGAFGALLVDGAIDYTALRKSLMAGTGPVTQGAVVEWLRTGHST